MAAAFFIAIGRAGALSHQQKGDNRMGTHSTVQLRQLWKQEELTVEQMVGHLLQHIEVLAQEIQALRKEVRVLQQACKP